MKKNKRISHTSGILSSTIDLIQQLRSFNNNIKATILFANLTQSSQWPGFSRTHAVIQRWQKTNQIHKRTNNLSAKLVFFKDWSVKPVKVMNMNQQRIYNYNVTCGYQSSRRIDIVLVHEQGLNLIGLTQRTFARETLKATAKPRLQTWTNQ